MGTAVAQGVAWLIKWFILRPLFFDTGFMAFYLWPWRQFLGCLRDGMEQRRVAYERVADFYYPWLFRATRRYFCPQEGAPGKSASCPLCDCQCAVIRAGPLYHRPVVWVGPVHYDDDYNLRRR